MKQIESRKEQIEYAGQIIAYGCSDELREALIKDFPELAESKDETMRKVIIDALRSHSNSINILSANGYSMDDVEDYFEKQKEQKPAVEEVLIRAGLKPFKDGNKWCILVGDNIQEGVCGFGDTIEDALYEFLKDVCKQNKSAEWSEEDNIIIKNVISYLNGEYGLKTHSEDYAHRKGLIRQLKSLRPQPKQEWSEEDEEILCIIINRVEQFDKWATERGYTLDDPTLKQNPTNWLKSLPERFNLQPIKEWNEEDEKMRTRVIGALERIGARSSTDSTSVNYCYPAEVAWLKSLRPQPKAELTLLDKNIIEAAVAFVKQNDHFNCWGGIDKHTVIKALYSLKHHWKPSEEQMEALRKAVILFGKFGSENSISDLHDINSLYEDLKKL